MWHFQTPACECNKKIVCALRCVTANRCASAVLKETGLVQRQLLKTSVEP